MLKNAAAAVSAILSLSNRKYMVPTKIASTTSSNILNQCTSVARQSVPARPRRQNKQVLPLLRKFYLYTV